MNKVTLIGRITKDLELKHIGEKNTANVKFNLAVDNYENGQKGADFIPVTVWGKQAENLCKYCGKGSQIAVNGALKIRSYDKDGVKKYITEVLADNFNGIEFLSKGNSTGESNSNTGNSEYDSNSNWEGTPIDDGDMPF